jgi:hypothetical protein
MQNLCLLSRGAGITRGAKKTDRKILKIGKIRRF